LRPAGPAKIALGARIGWVAARPRPRPREGAARYGGSRHVGPPGRAPAGAAVAIRDVHLRAGGNFIPRRAAFAFSSGFHRCASWRMSALRRDPRM
jgi:hypothetical protein